MFSCLIVLTVATAPYQLSALQRWVGLQIADQAHNFCALQDYLKATGTFNLNEAFPNLASHPYHWRVDPYEPNR